MPNQDISLNTYDPQGAAIQRQQQLAQMLQQQAFEPIQTNSYNGIQAPISPFQGLAKILQGYSARKMQDRADQKIIDLQASRRSDLANMLSQQFQKPGVEAQGIRMPDIAETQGSIPNPMGGVPSAMALPAVKGDPLIGSISNGVAARPTTTQEQMANALALMGSGNPMAAQIAPQLYGMAANRDEKTWENVQPMSAAMTQQIEAQGRQARDTDKYKNELPQTAQEKAALAEQANYHRLLAARQGGGFPGLTAEENEALTTGIGNGTIDPARINSRTAKLYAGIAMRDPSLNMVNAQGHAAMVRNAPYQRTINVAESLPTVLENVRAAGKKLNYSDVAAVGKIQGWARGQVNDPDVVSYMTQRNDALLSVASVMRGVGMSDMATRMEGEASAPTMSPRALDAWVDAQQKSLAPRLTQYRKNELGDIKPNAMPSAPAIPAPNANTDPLGLRKP